ncbi:hypothetical protein EJ05DRAFT_333933 [Pseudovirgaria hyperparasitica]|uniref:Uncharacterized protein n=1 Tax=Pseudovirgaria hyperparasitica TaxID=470096 RepID=A0A6A6WBC0_9PEZI|nr:uncharacterized protein EJ05DRAFT_333933 [Pseudovirgaria hyperparasitica]KAF2759136.1 hypothetical protein EJ05DRAFT_333933 [Pseudovirgaria hyperparasitica]
MAPSLKMPEIPSDILVSIFETLVGDSESLIAAGLTCTAWHAFSLPYLLYHVDLSCHNRGRLPEFEDDVVMPVVYASFNDKFKPGNLVPRQRAFLQLMTDRPELATHVHSFTWTLVYSDCSDLTDIDRETWVVFDRLNSVTRLDLAQILGEREIEYSRQPPPRLFPAVTDLRLVGSMNRKLVRAIITALEPSDLRSLRLDHLGDEGSLPGGLPMLEDLADPYIPNLKNRAEISGPIDEALFQRQESGSACVFPGPMWFPLRLLSSHSLSLTHLEVKLAPINMEIDLRNYETMYQHTVRIMLKTRKSLESLVLYFGNDSIHYEEPNSSGCGTDRLTFSTYVDHHPPPSGYDYGVPGQEEYEELLKTS